MFVTLIAPLLALACTVTDGDTIRCGPGTDRSERIRLLGIDAPELGGHCRRGRQCAAGDPIAARDSLRQAFRAGSVVTLLRTGQDRYGRTLAWVTVDGRDLSCRQLRGHFAIYKPEWDPHGRLRAACR